jgi:Rrf2 family iron-sulfur cluster assembly transcriptional regulator
MMDLALQGSEAPVTLAEISARQQISLSYLEQLFGKLRRHALVSSVRGPGGGYRIAKPTNEISVADIIIAVDEPIDATQCGGKENCQDDHKCLTHDLWANLNAHIFTYLRAVSLGELVRNHQAKGAVAVIQMTDRRPGAPSSVAA